MRLPGLKFREACWNIEWFQRTWCAPPIDLQRHGDPELLVEIAQHPEVLDAIAELDEAER